MRMRPALALSALLLAAPACAHAATATGTLDLAEGGAPAPAALAYGWEGAPLLDGPAASARLGRPGLLLRNASWYAEISLRSVIPGPALPSPPGCPGGWRRLGPQSVAIADPRALLRIDAPTLDVLRGRGTADIVLASAGGGPTSLGEYVATGTARVTTDGCWDAETGEPVPGDDGGPFRAVHDVPAAAVDGSDRLLSRFAPGMLETAPVTLRLRDGAWRGELALVEEEAPPYPATSARLAIAITGTPVELGAHCTIPPRLRSPDAKVKSRRAALALLRRAGFARPRYAGKARGAARGRYFVSSTSSELPCSRSVRVKRGR